MYSEYHITDGVLKKQKIPIRKEYEGDGICSVLYNFSFTSSSFKYCHVLSMGWAKTRNPETKNLKREGKRKNECFSPFSSWCWDVVECLGRWGYSWGGVQRVWYLYKQSWHKDVCAYKLKKWPSWIEAHELGWRVTFWIGWLEVSQRGLCFGR